jgi:hypothetical protein
MDFSGFLWDRVITNSNQILLSAYPRLDIELFMITSLKAFV